MFILALPVLLETDFILNLWLKQYPDHTVNFVRLVLLLSLSDILSNTLITLQNANGNIRNYQIAVGGMLMMNFPLSYCCLKAGFPSGIHIGGGIVRFRLLPDTPFAFFAPHGSSFRQAIYTECMS